jgi:ABC-type nitrate/sulfonate/bicarbonate transport system substrate-binding protein
MPADADLLPRSVSAPSLTRPLPAMTVGYVPLTDAAPLLVAGAKGFFRREGVEVGLAPAASWATLRDRLAFGSWHAAHTLAPIPIATALGLGGVQASLHVGAHLGRAGNTIVLGEALAAELAAGSGQPVLPSLVRLVAARRGAGRPAPVFGVVFPFSSHNYLLRHWFAAAGIDPDHDVRLVAVPPPNMPEQLASGAIEGFCAGEPWGSRAVDLRVGRIVLTTGDIWKLHLEKVVAFSESGLAQGTDAAVGVIAGVIAASRWLADAENADEAADILHDAALPGVPAQVVALALRGELARAPDQEPEASPGVLHHSGASTYPDPAPAHWFLRQMQRWGHAPSSVDPAMIARVWRDDLWRAAASRLGEPVPSPHAFPEGPVDFPRSRN